MRRILIRSRVGEGGVLHLDVPSELAGSEVEVTITPTRAPGAGRTVADGWSPGFFEDVVGAWKGEPLIREPEGEFETRRLS